MLDKRASRIEERTSSDGHEAEEMFSSQVLDTVDEDQPSDYIPTAPLDDPAAELTASELRRLDGFLKTAQKLSGPQHDAKLAEVTQTVAELLAEGYSPIVYCRFIATAEYVAEQLLSQLQRAHTGLHVVSVTGGDGDNEQRLEKVACLAEEPMRVLVATDCLSEGINLQDHFDAVVHYDLPWNPNRLEQREGRVDRFGQKRSTIKTVLLYGSDNPIDLVVLRVLIRKAQTIRQQLGISVPVPVESDQVVQAIVDSVLLRGREQGQQLQLGLSDPKVSSLHAEWDRRAEHEGRLRAYFAQQGIKPDEVARELEEMEPALGNTHDVRGFVGNALQRFNGDLRGTRQDGVFELHPGDLRTPMGIRNGNLKFPLRVAFDGIPPDGVTLLGRNHAVVATLSDAVLARALSGDDDQFSRCGAIFTDAVQIRTAVAVLRLRYLLEETTQQFGEEVVVAAFQRSGQGIEWLHPLQSEALKLITATKVTANMAPQERIRQVEWALGMLEGDWFQEIIQDRVHSLEESHRRLRAVIKTTQLKVVPHEPPDILGCYVLVPTGGGR
jgi:hypothetical protein